MSEEDWAELREELGLFARHLCGGPHFTRLYSLTRDQGGRRKQTTVLVLLSTSGSARHFAYEPQSGAFVEVESADAVSEYVCGLACWATDLLALFRGEFGPSGICFGRHRRWCLLDGGTPTIEDALWMYQHPLRRPDRFLALYRRLLASEPAEVPRVRAHLDCCAPHAVCNPAA